MTHPEAFDLDAYLARIGIDAPRKNDARALTRLHRAQAFAIPFENFDVLLGRGVSLAPEALCAKLLGERRGGYCFELNGLFELALEALGFAPTTLLARVYRADGTPGPKTHQLARLVIDGTPWIADVGFGRGSLREPIPLEADVVHDQDGQVVRLRRDGEHWVYQLRSRGEWRNQYRFDFSEVLPVDRELGNHYTSTHPSSPFVQYPMVTRPTPTGRVALLGDRLRTVTGDDETVERAPNGQALLELLRERFDIELDAAPEELPGWPAPDW